ncbi:MAG: transcriptional repressor [Alphaproteobacteria bacterium]|nr:transcriptional repressor [Alphaproteobacteria bacterium]
MSQNTAKKALEAAETLCAERGERLTPVRRRVLELVLSAEKPVKAYDLLELLKPGEGSAKPPTVYRALDFLMGMGLVHKVEALNAFVGCTHSHDGQGAELFICNACGSVEERHTSAHAHGADEGPSSCCPDGFIIERSVVEHFGRCRACATA